MDLFSSVSATPRIVISLFPPVIAGDWSQIEEPTPDDSASENPPENGLPSIASPSIASAIPPVLRTSLDSTRRLKDTESDTSSIHSKHTEISSAGPPGTGLIVRTNV